VSAERLGQTTQSSKRQTQNPKLSSGSTAAGEPKTKNSKPKTQEHDVLVVIRSND
jgi:hypothetical protein